MTKNQQRIISNLIAEFNKQNEAKEKQPFKLIDLDEFDAIRQRHIELTADAIRNKDVWENNRLEYIYELIDKIRDDLGDRLVVMRGDDATDNPNYFNYIYIYKHNTPQHLRWEYALRMEFELIQENVRDEITRETYVHYKGICIRTFIDRNYSKRYENEVDFFNCQYTKDKLKDLLS